MLKLYLLLHNVVFYRKAEHILQAAPKHALGRNHTIKFFAQFSGIKGGESSSQFQWFTIAKIEL